MSKKILLLICLAFPLAGSAQNAFKAGFIGGIPTSQVDGDGYGGFNKIGLAGGVFTNIFFDNDFGAEIEVLYIQKGSRKSPTKNNPGFYSLRLSYAEIPVLLKYKTGKFIAEGGPSFGRLLTSSERDINGEIPGMDPFKEWEVSLNLGLAYPIDDHLDVSVRLSSSIIPIRSFQVAGARVPFFDRLLNAGQYNTVLGFSPGISSSPGNVEDNT